MEAERDKDNHGRASEIFSRSMASGSSLLLDAAANRLKLPLSLCQDENAQLYLAAEESWPPILCARQLCSTDTLRSRAGRWFGARPRQCVAGWPPQPEAPHSAWTFDIHSIRLDFEDIVLKARTQPESCQKCNRWHY